MGHASEEDFQGLFEDLDLGSSKLGKTENQKNDLIAKVLVKMEPLPDVSTAPAPPLPASRARMPRSARRPMRTAPLGRILRPAIAPMRAAATSRPISPPASTPTRAAMRATT